MPIRVRDKGKDFVPPPSGLQQAVCCDVVELGMVDTPFGKKRKVRLCFQSEHKMEDGRPFIVMQSFGATLHKKGTLRPALEGWRGRAFTDEEANDFDLEVLIGKPCQLNVIHNTKDGVTYGNIQSIIPAAKGASALKIVNYTRVQDRDGYKAPEMPPEREPGDETETEVVVEDDIPF